MDISQRLSPSSAVCAHIHIHTHRRASEPVSTDLDNHAHPRAPLQPLPSNCWWSIGPHTRTHMHTHSNTHANYKSKAATSPSEN